VTFDFQTFRLFIFMRLFLITLLAAGPLAAESATDPVLGQAGDVTLTVRSLRPHITALPADQQAGLAADPAALAQYVRALLIQQLVVKKALAEKHDQQTEVAAQLIRAREAALAESYLNSLSQPDPGYPAEAELTAAYEAAKDQLQVPTSHQLAQIYIAGAEDDAAAKGKLAEVTKALAAPAADFSVLARSHSDDASSAPHGGELGWLAESQIQPGIRSQLPKLKPGAVSAAIRQESGWHFIKLIDTRAAHTPPLDQIREPLAARLRQEKAARLRQDILIGLLGDNPIAINEIELSKAVRPATAQTITP